MTRCSKYWAIAEIHADLFDRINGREFSAAETIEERYSETLQEKYKSVLQELDHHTLSCPDCQQ